MSYEQFDKLLEVTRRPELMADKPEPPGDMSDQSKAKVDAAVERLSEWVHMDVDPGQIRAVLWAAAMESKNSNVVPEAISALYDDIHREQDELDSEMEQESETERRENAPGERGYTSEPYESTRDQSEVPEKDLCPVCKKRPIAPGRETCVDCSH